MLNIYYEKRYKESLTDEILKNLREEKELELKKEWINYTNINLFLAKNWTLEYEIAKSKLYKELINWYAKPGDKVLDTHLGSGSIAIACYDFGYELTACELDEDYYNDSINRIKNHIANNQSLFAPEELLPKKIELFD